MKDLCVVTWNVNGLRARWDHVQKLISDYEPDVLMLQEVKCDERDICLATFYNAGYYVSSNTSGGKHGVMTLIKQSLYDEHMNHLTPRERNVEYLVELGDSRVNITKILDLWLVNVYINQGQEVGSHEYRLKLKLMDNVRKFLQDQQAKHIIIGGDFNICPNEEDVWSTDHWDESTLSRTSAEILSMYHLMNDHQLVNSDEIMAKGHNFTWYGYRHWWRKYNNLPEGKFFVDDGRYGIKCDHIISSNHIGRINSAIDMSYRTCDNPSDHVPLFTVFANVPTT